MGHDRPPELPKVQSYERFVVEQQGIGLDESALALAALRALRGPSRELVAKTLRQLVTRTD